MYSHRCSCSNPYRAYICCISEHLIEITVLKKSHSVVAPQCLIVSLILNVVNAYACCCLEIANWMRKCTEEINNVY